VKISDSLVAGNRKAGAQVQDSTLELKRCVVRGTRPQLSDDLYGIGLFAPRVSRTTVIDLRDSLVTGNRMHGVLLAGARGTLQRSVIRDTASEAGSRQFGGGVRAQPDKTTQPGAVAPATLEMTECVVARNREEGIALWGATATIERCLVSRSGASDLKGAFGDGVFLTPFRGLAARLTLTDSVIAGSARAGLFSKSAGGAVHQSVFRDGIFSVVLEEDSRTTLGPSNLYQGNKENRPTAKEIPPVRQPRVPDL
jgi:hypothetical protein